MLSILFPLVSPEPLEPLRRQFRIAHGMLDVLVPQVVLDGAGVVAVIRQFVPAPVPEHVGMDGEAHGGFFPGAREEFAKPRRRHRSAPFARKHIRPAGRSFPFQLPQCPQFRPA